jgi:peptidoglycan hydrolase-like protein with peptidoglycan-binding domain
MPATAISRELLATYEGLHISDICTAVRFVDDAQNHCAHFVNHVLGFDEPLTCGRLVGRPGAAANIRVHETFAKCPSVGAFEDKPALGACFAFVTLRSAVDLATRTMTNVPKKHIGIFCDGEIWHYANAKRKVVRETPEVFARHFAGSGFALFFGTFPSGTQALLVPTPATANSASAATLKRGLTDNVDVAVWQQFLILQGFLSGPDIHKILDGGFGPKTEDATEAFQAAAGLPMTGEVDAATNTAATERGFVPRGAAKPRTALTQVTPAMTTGAIDALRRLSATRVFYTEEVLDADGGHVIARLEPHKHTSGTQLRFWHRGITLYPFTGVAPNDAVPVTAATAGHAGIDTSVYPGDDVMDHLKNTTNLVWTGFYLGPAPSHPNTSWMTRRARLVQQGWGLAPIYVGQQESGGPGSHDVNGTQGEADGAQAVELATQAEFPAGSILYLDIERGGPISAPMRQYLERWCARVAAAGFRPGAYLSHTSAASAHAAVPNLELWVFRIRSADVGVEKDPPFRTDPPSDSGIAEALAWQWAQNCRIPKPGGRLLVDVDVASSADPSRVS